MYLFYFFPSVFRPKEMMASGFDDVTTFDYLTASDFVGVFVSYSNYLVCRII